MKSRIGSGKLITQDQQAPDMPLRIELSSSEPESVHFRSVDPSCIAIPNLSSAAVGEAQARSGAADRRFDAIANRARFGDRAYQQACFGHR